FTPILKSGEVVEVELPTGSRRVTTFPKLVSRDKRVNISFKSDTLTIETTDYKGWESFRALAGAALAAREDIAPVDGVERIGLRYIDEIRVSDATPVDWSQWVSESLLGPNAQAAGAQLRIQQQQCAIQYASTVHASDSYTLRYGSGFGQVFQSQADLVRPNDTPSGEFFLIDTDGAWADIEKRIPEFHTPTLLEACDRIHAPIKELFESLITDELRKVFDDEQ
ncbi:TIGR04255 family protein, partial [Bacillus cereus]|uniref:TIGR04255 family protein n=1 Tax=Bacillus cereus TaxID=1396 RepID=UPI003672CF24